MNKSEKQTMPPQEQQPPGLESEMHPLPRYRAERYLGSDKLKGQVALITGGDSGIGRAVAVLYAREGANVAIVYLDVEHSDADETRRAVEAEGQRCLLIPGDVTDSHFCERAVEAVVGEFGSLNILVNNAAYQREQESIEDITDEQLDRTFRTNIFGYFYMARAALKVMSEGAVIINCGSVAGMRGSKSLIDYASTKGAIHAFTKSLAQNLAPRKIRVNCVAPGPIWTVLQPSTRPKEKVAKLGSETPMERPGQPEEVSPAFVFLASAADSSYISGEVLTVLGGEPTAA